MSSHIIIVCILRNFLPPSDLTSEAVWFLFTPSFPKISIFPAGGPKKGVPFKRKNKKKTKKGKTKTKVVKDKKSGR